MDALLKNKHVSTQGLGQSDKREQEKTNGQGGRPKRSRSSLDTRQQRRRGSGVDEIDASAVVGRANDVQEMRRSSRSATVGG